MKDHMEGFHMNKNETDALVIHEILAIQSLAQRMREPPDWSGARLSFQSLIYQAWRGTSRHLRRRT